MNFFSKSVNILKYGDITIFLVVTLIIFILIDEYYRRKRWLMVKNHVSTVPIIGSVHMAIGKKCAVTEYLKLYNTFKSPFYLRFFYEDVYVTMQPGEIRTILLNSDCLNKGAVYYPFKMIGPNSILIAEKNIWTPKRRYFSKAFNQMRLNKLMPQINRTCDKFIESIASRKGNDNIKETFARIIIDGAMETLLGCEITEINNPLCKKVNTYLLLKMFFRGVVDRYTKPWLYFDFIYLRSENGKIVTKLLKDFYNAISYIMKMRREQFKNQKEEQRDKDLISIAIEENLSEEEIVNDIFIFLTAATESSTITTGLSLILLGMHKHFQKKLYEEVIDVIGESTFLDQNHLANLKYTEMVINETLRLFPPAPFIYRRLDKDVDLGDKILPKNANVAISIYGVQRSEELWENPTKFNPERFLPTEVAKRDQATFLPFSLGPRNCIGKKYSMMLIKTIIATIMKTYEVSSDYQNIEDIKVSASVSLDVEEIRCTFKSRTNI